MKDSFQADDSAGSTTTKQRSAGDVCGIRSDVEVTVRDKYGNIKHHSVQRNLRTNLGSDFWNTQLFSTSPGGAGANYIALTADATAAAAGDSTLASELATNGLARAQGSIAHTASAGSSVISHTWTYTGSSPVVIAKAGLFNASANGTMVLETLLNSTATVSANGDQVTVNWTVNF